MSQQQRTGNSTGDERAWDGSWAGASKKKKVEHHHHELLLATEEEEQLQLWRYLGKGSRARNSGPTTFEQEQMHTQLPISEHSG